MVRQGSAKPLYGGSIPPGASRVVGLSPFGRSAIGRQNPYTRVLVPSVDLPKAEIPAQAFGRKRRGDEMVDIRDLKSLDRKVVRVRVSPPASHRKSYVILSVDSLARLWREPFFSAKGGSSSG